MKTIKNINSIKTYQNMKVNAFCNVKPIISSMILILFFLTSCSKKTLQKQTTELKDFKIVIERTEKGIQMNSTEGSAWLDLSFNINNYQPQAVDEFGMADLKNVSKSKNKNLADYLFTILKTEQGIELKGIEGTAWTELKFSLTTSNKQAIDQFGMTSIN